jgi:hypothetical protein
MEIPPGLSMPEAVGKVCRLKKNLCMVSSNLYVHGLIDLDEHCVVWALNNAMGITLCSTDTQSVVLQC